MKNFFFHSSTIKELINSDFAKYFYSILIGMIFVFGLLIAMVWLLPVEIFGTLVLIKSLLIIISSISNFGLSQSLVKFINDKDLSTNILGHLYYNFDLWNFIFNLIVNINTIFKSWGF